MLRHPAAALAALSLLTFSAAAQDFDTSANNKLNGAYFVREVLIAGQNSDNSIAQAKSVIGAVTFDGAGHYSFTGQLAVSTGGASTVTLTGNYILGPNGLFRMTSLCDQTDLAYGTVAGIGPSAIVASTTENGNSSMLVAIPAGGGVNNGSLSGAYTGGLIDFTGGNATLVRQARFSLSANGAGSFGTFAATGNAVNINSGGQVTQNVSGATYSLSGTGSGTASFGAASPTQVLSGSKNFYISADGNILLAGNPQGFDILVAARAISGTASNATAKGLYLTAGLELDPTNGSAVDSFYGSANATGTGVTIEHDRFQYASIRGSSDPPYVYDYTYDREYTVASDATVNNVGYYNTTYAAGGKAFIATGTRGLYSLYLGFAAPAFTGTGVFINPTGVVNAANFAPFTNPVAPNEIMTMFGSGLANSTVSATTVPLPNTLGGVQVTVNGTPAPLFYVSPGQISFLVPPSISPEFHVANATFQVTNNGAKSNQVTLYTWTTAPGIFSAAGSGIGPAAATHVNGSLISSSNPALAKETIVVYAGGLGSTSPVVPSGAPSPTNPPAKVDETDHILKIGGTKAQIGFEGLTPGLSGLYQLNVTLGADTPAGDQYVDLATEGAFTSSTTAYISGTTAKAVSAARASGPARPSRPTEPAAGKGLRPQTRFEPIPSTR